MLNDPGDVMNVSFPADARFHHLGALAVASLTLRLGVDQALVENLRTAVRQAIVSLGETGRIEISAEWTGDIITLKLKNSSASLTSVKTALSNELLAYVDRATVTAKAITLGLDR